jgi:hypothetical protein
MEKAYLKMFSGICDCSLNIPKYGKLCNTLQISCVLQLASNKKTTTKGPAVRMCHFTALYSDDFEALLSLNNNNLFGNKTLTNSCFLYL